MSEKELEKLINKGISVLLGAIYLVILFLILILNEVIHIHDYVINTIIALMIIIVIALMIITLYPLLKGDYNVWEKAF